MIPATIPLAQPSGWQQLWREAITDPSELLSILGLSHMTDRLLPAAMKEFRLRVPRGFVARMRYGDSQDPLLLQVLPQIAELIEVHGFLRDAVGDLNARAAQGVLHKYQGRALLITTGSCAIHCRYCFRRHFPYSEETAAANHWNAAIDYIRQDNSISEIILSGGDPFSLSTAKLEELTEALRTVTHIRRLRIHTRLPIVLPERVDSELINWVNKLPWPTVIVTHVNHANEIDAHVIAACLRLRQTGVMLLNQSVLLRGINDSVESLVFLSERLLECAILPYYIHQLDQVTGAAHFEVEDAHSLALMEAVRQRLPGYLVPKLVREIPGLKYKAPVERLSVVL